MSPSLFRRGLAAAAALACALTPVAGAARPYTIEDYLRREAVGSAQAAPGGRWLVVERLGPRLAATRFDYDSLNDLFRTRILVADLARAGPLRPLRGLAPDAGYKAGPISPDGRRMAVHRLRDERWELGIADLATRKVRWLDVHPELNAETHSLAWTSPTSLLVIARTADATPWWVSAMHPYVALPDRWRRSARGGRAVTVLGAGPDQALGYAPAPKALLRLDAITGRAKVLARGDFWDLEVSRTRAHAAIVERGPLIAMRADHAVHGDEGVAVTRRRLRLLEIATGLLTSPAGEADLLGGLLSWAPDRDLLLVYVRQDGAPWSAGRLLRLDAASGAIDEPGQGGFRPRITGRPEAIRAAWWNGRPLVLGRTTQASRDDWALLAADGARALTASLLVTPLTVVVAGPDRLLAESQGRVYALDPAGAATPQAAGSRLVRPPPPPFRNRDWYVQPDAAQTAIARPDAAAPEAPRDAPSEILESADGVQGALAAPMGAQLLALGPSGALTLESRGGSARDLVWHGAASAPRRLLTLNPAEAEVDPLIAKPVRHLDAAGRPRTSWLVLPPRAPGSRAPPLIVWPYPSSVFNGPPGFLDPAQEGAGRIPLLLAHHGYAVLVPSLPDASPDPGPGLGLAGRVLAIVDAAAADPALLDSFDPERLGLVGLSHGGYAVNAILGQTRRFRSAVSIASSSDLASMWGVLPSEHRIHPEENGPGLAWSPGWAEAAQGHMNAPPWAAPGRYLANSPLFNAGGITTPLLLIQGDQDSQPLAEAERIFSAIARQDGRAQLAIYWGEGHVMASPGNLRDMVQRMFDWLDRDLARAAADQAGAIP